MPLYKTLTINPNTVAHVWKVTETEDNLWKSVKLTNNCQERMKGMKSAIHRRAFLSIRHLLFIEGYEDADLFYDEVGKPHLKDGKFISITHSNNFTAIIVSSSHEVGIDIEMQRDKILRIAHKFTPLQEYRTIANTEALIQKLTVVWGAKESLYKIYGQKGLSFLNHIYVSDFMFNDPQLQATVSYCGETTNYTLAFLEFEGFTCVYALKNQSTNN